MTKSDFDKIAAGLEDAIAYHTPVATLCDWEQGRRQPDAPARALLAVIAADPTALERILAGR